MLWGSAQTRRALLACGVGVGAGACASAPDAPSIPAARAKHHPRSNSPFMTASLLLGGLLVSLHGIEMARGDVAVGASLQIRVEIFPGVVHELHTAEVG